MRKLLICFFVLLALNFFYVSSSSETINYRFAPPPLWNYQAVSRCRIPRLSILIPVHRYWNGINHLYTVNPNEIGTVTLGAVGHRNYVYQGVAFYMFQFKQPCTIPLHRFSTGADSFCSTNMNPDLRKPVAAIGGRFYRRMGILGYAYTSKLLPDTAPLYHYSNGIYNFYTTNQTDAELNNRASNYKFKSIICYVFPTFEIRNKMSRFQSTPLNLLTTSIIIQKISTSKTTQSTKVSSVQSSTGSTLGPSSTTSQSTKSTTVSTSVKSSTAVASSPPQSSTISQSVESTASQSTQSTTVSPSEQSSTASSSGESSTASQSTQSTTASTSNQPTAASRPAQ